MTVIKKAVKKEVTVTSFVEKINLSSDAMALELQAKDATISENAQKAFVQNSVSRLKRAAKWCNESNDILEFIAKNSDNATIDYLVSLDSAIKTIDRVRNVAHYLYNEKMLSTQVVFAFSALSKLSRTYDKVSVNQFLNSTMTDKNKVMSAAAVKCYIRAFEQFKLVSIDGARHKCGADYSAILYGASTITFNNELLKQYDL